MLAMLAAYILMGCTKQQHQQSVVPANAVLLVLVDAYRRDGLACVSDSSTRSQAESCIAASEQKWVKVWALWDTYRSYPESLDAFCNLVHAVPPSTKVPSSAKGLCHDDGF